MNKHTLRMRQF